MSVTIKSPQEIELMREAGKILAKVHEQLGKELKPGMSTLEVDRLGEEMIRSFGCEPSFKGYQGYPASICVSINEEVVHGKFSLADHAAQVFCSAQAAGTVNRKAHTDHSL